jgi:hypothetical protein
VVVANGRVAAPIALLAGLWACNAPVPPSGTGVDIEAGPCGRGFVVVSSDYQSTNVALVDFDGQLLTPSLVSSATEAAGLTAPLSDDVVVPSGLMAGERIVLLDRFLTSVVSWVDVRSAEFGAQLSLRTGFRSNPRDYAEISPDKAYVTRYEPNSRPGSEPFDGGNDLLIVDPNVPAITGRIDLSSAMAAEEAGFFPRADRALLAGGRLLVVLAGYDAAFDDSAPSRIAAVDVESDVVGELLVLDGLHGCSGIALSPSGSTVALACPGDDLHASTPSLEQSGLAIVDVGPPLVERKRIHASELGHGVVGLFVDFASEERLLTVTLGHEGGLADALVEVNIESGTARTLLQSSGTPFTLGEVRCAAACGVCFIADAGRGGAVIHRLEVGSGGAAEPRALRLSDGIGLPPRYLGRF